MRTIRLMGKGPREVIAAASAASLMFLAGCHLTEFRETYHVGVSADNAPGVQFYRFDLDGRSGWTKTQFVSGWYSSAAIESLAGSGLGDPLKELAAGAAQPESTRYYITGPEGKLQYKDHAQLAIIMSSDPEPVTQAIKAFADSDAIKTAIAAASERRNRVQEERRASLQKLRDFVGQLPEGEQKGRILQALGMLEALSGGQG